jgi:hypothetical protein
LAIKLVRGAYLSSEEKKYLQPSKEDSDKAYNRSAKAIIEYLSESRGS